MFCLIIRQSLQSFTKLNITITIHTRHYFFNKLYFIERCLLLLFFFIHLTCATTIICLSFIVENIYTV